MTDNDLVSYTAVDMLSAAGKNRLKQEFGQRVYARMLEKGWNRSELARRADLTRDAVAKYTRGAHLPTPESLAKLAHALGVDPGELIPDVTPYAESDALPRVQMSILSGGRASLRIEAIVSVETAFEVARLVDNDKASAK